MKTGCCLHCWHKQILKVGKVHPLGTMNAHPVVVEILKTKHDPHGARGKVRGSQLLL